MSPEPKLPPRLAAAAQMAGTGRRFADIGTDHALLPAFLLCRDRFDSALLCDIVPGPLERAAACVRRYGLEDRCELRLTDGMRGLSPDDFDTAAICGMGGLNILDILRDARTILKPSHRLILQPQTDILSVRAWLKVSGFTPEAEQAVCEERRCYTVLTVRPPNECPEIRLTEEEVLLRFCDDRTVYLGGLRPAERPDDAAYLRHCLRLYRPMRDGALHGEKTALSEALQTLIQHLERELRTEETS